MVGEAWKAATEATLMIAPPWPMCGIAARQLRKTARRLSETTLSQPSLLMAATGAVKREPPATLTSTSSRPVASTARATAASTASSSVTSVVTTSAVGAPAERAAAATFSSSSVEREASTTAAPAPARVRAACSPMPRLAPVISAVRPCRPKSGAAVTGWSWFRRTSPRPPHLAAARQETSRLRGSGPTLREWAASRLPHLATTRGGGASFHRHGEELGGAGRGTGLARVHADGDLRRQPARDRRAGRGQRAGRRRRPPLPRRHLLTMGLHPRPPRPRARRRPGRAARPRRPLHHARQRQPRGGRAGRGPRRGRARRRPALPVRLRRRRGGRAGAQARLAVLGQPGRARPHLRPRLRRRLPRRHGRVAVARRRRLRHRPVRPAALPGAARSRVRAPRLLRGGRRHGGRARGGAGRGGGGAAGAGRGRDAHRPARGLRRARRSLPPRSRAADLRRGGHRLRPDRHAVRLRALRPAPGPALPRQGARGRLPADVGHGGERPRAPRLPRRGAPGRADGRRGAPPRPAGGTPGPARLRRGGRPRRAAPAPRRRGGADAAAHRDRRRAGTARRGPAGRDRRGGTGVIPPASGSGATPSPAPDGPARGIVAPSWRAWAAGECGAIRRADHWRAVRTLDLRAPAAPAELDGRQVVSFAANDYLGLSAHPEVVAAAHAALDRWGAGSGAARLVTGGRPVHAELEAELADWKGTESALLFPTGYAANLGVLATFRGPGTRIHSV